MAGFEGGCACGRTRYRMESEPLFVHCCHCLRCQRETGSAFVLNALIETDRLALLADPPSAVAVPTDSGKSHRIFRCQACQTAIASEYGGVEKLRFVRVGTLDEPHALKPDVHIYTRSKVPWIALPEGALAFEAYYDSRKVWPEASLRRRAAAFY
jgi:hypothetical protein